MAPATLFIDVAAHLARVSRRTIYIWLRMGLLPYRRVGTSRRVSLTDVVRLRDRERRSLRDQREVDDGS